MRLLSTKFDEDEEGVELELHVAPCVIVKLCVPTGGGVVPHSWSSQEIVSELGRVVSALTSNQYSVPAL